MYKRLKDYEGNGKGLFTGLISDKPLLKQKQYKEEATAYGLEYLGKAHDDHGKLQSSYSYYEWTECGHRSDYQMTHVRMKNAVCKECLNNKYKEQAKQVGYIILGKAENNQVEFRSARRVDCGHIRDVRYANFSGGTTLDSVCPVCYEERLAVEADENGLTLMGAGKDHAGTYRRYRFNACGHERDIHAPCVAIGRFICTGCQEDMWKAVALEQGLEYLGAPATKTDKSNKKFKLPCGCIKDLRIDHVRGGRWCCNTCSDYHYVRPSNVYLYRITNGDTSWLKLGYAKDLRLRKNSYGLTSGCTSVLIHSLPFDTGYKALTFESMLHRKYKEFNLDKRLMKTFHTFSGHTECYPVSIENDIVMDILNYKEPDGNS